MHKLNACLHPIVPCIFVPCTDNTTLTLQWRGNNGVAQLGLKGHDNECDERQSDTGYKKQQLFIPFKCGCVESNESQTSWLQRSSALLNIYPTSAWLKYLKENFSIQMKCVCTFRQFYFKKKKTKNCFVFFSRNVLIIFDESCPYGG